MNNYDISRMLKMGTDFMKSLPKEIQGPSITTSDHYLEFEWYKNPRHIISALIDPTGKVHWAALINEEDPRGNFYVAMGPHKLFLEYLDKFTGTPDVQQDLG